MNSLKSEDFKNLIQNLSEENFKALIKTYLQEYWDTTEVNIIDGPWDGGIDLEIYKDGKLIKRNIQVTVQKNGLESKLDSDLQNSKNNVKKYEYQNKLDFYISLPISKSKKNELIKSADLNYQIDLKIIDAIKLSDELSEYNRTREQLISIYLNSKPNEKFKVDKQTKVIFDMLSIGSDTSKIKNHFIESYILLFFYEYPNSNVNQVKLNLDKKFNTSYSLDFYQNNINNLLTKGKLILLPDSTKRIFLLAEEARQIISDNLLLANSQESLLIQQIQLVLKKYKIESQTQEFANFLQRIYRSNYETDIEEINSTHETFNPKARKTYYKLVDYLKKTRVPKETQKDLIKDLLMVCETNEYLNKISISNMFTSLYKSEKLEKYLSQQTRNVYLDTQILLQFICYKFKKTDYEDILYTAVGRLTEFWELNKGRVNLLTTEDYVEEVAGHIWEAIKLEKLLSLPYIEALGYSKNVIFNYYLYLKNNGIQLYEDFSEFIESFLGFEITVLSKSNFISEIYCNIKERLEYIGVEVINHPLYDDYQKYKKEYEIIISFIRKDFKTYTAREHDLRTILYLSDEMNHIDSETEMFNEPFFATWDSSFYQIRHKFNNKFRNLSYWYLYTPTKLLNRFYVMDFKLDSSSINYNIITLTESNFNFNSDSISFIDLLASFFNKENITDWQLGHKLSQLRQKQLNDTALKDFSEHHSNNLPIDEMLSFIHKAYHKPESKYKFNELLRTFENENNSDTITDMILSSMANYLSNPQIENEIIVKMNKIIESNR